MGQTPDLPPWQDNWKTISLEKWIGVIRRGTYQAASDNSRWKYEPLFDLWKYIDPDSDYINDSSSD